MAEQEEAKAAAPVVDGDDRKLENAPADEAGRTESSTSDITLHVSCRDFGKRPISKVRGWLQEVCSVPLLNVFKLSGWNYAFVTVATEDDAKQFREVVDGVNFGSHPAIVKAGRPRGEGAPAPRRQRETGGDGGQEGDGGGDGGPPNAKRQKTNGGKRDFPAGYVPTLKDLKDRAKQRRGPGNEGVLEKSAPLLPWPYETQLAMKDTYVKSALRSLTKQVRKRCEDLAEEAPAWTMGDWSIAARAPKGCGCPMDPPVGTPPEAMEGYRNKCEFTIGRAEDGRPEVGFVLSIRPEGDQLVASCEGVPHVPAAMKRLCAALRESVRASPFPVYDRSRAGRKGCWRLLMARQTPAGELLVLIQIASLGEEDQRRFTQLLLEALAPADLGVTSIYLQLNDEVSDAARPGAPILHLHGAQQLDMPLMGLRFRLGPLSFFQANTVTCAALYGKALEWLRPEGSLVLDVCCGVGTIGLCAAGHCRRVIGVELVPEAVESARENAALNAIENAEFHAGKAEEVLPRLLSGIEPDTPVCAVVDPPRPGLHRSVTAALRACQQLSRLVYVSCNPESLVEDVVALTAPQEKGGEPFVPLRAVAVDMFPHTLHCEMVLLLERASRVPDPRATAPPLVANSLERSCSAGDGGSAPIGAGAGFVKEDGGEGEGAP